MKNGKLQIGIIGCGGIANMKHMPTLTKLNDMAEMVAFCDLIPQRAKDAASKYGTADAKTYVDYKELLNDDTIDVVHICTPNMSHATITVDSFAAGKHVLCEKPMAATTADAKLMLDAYKKSGKKFTIGYQNRFRNDVQTVYNACSQGELGDIYFAKAHALRRRAVPTWGVFMDKEKQGGGPLIDIGTHALDITLWLMNNYKPKSVTGSIFHKMADKTEGNVFGPWDPATFDVEDSAFGFIKMENGATIYLESSWILNSTDTREAATTLCGTEGGMEMKGLDPDSYEPVFNSVKYGRLMEEKPSNLGSIAFFGPLSQTPAEREARQWLNSIINDTQPLVKPEQAFVVTQILESIYISARTGKMIEL